MNGSAVRLQHCVVQSLLFLFCFPLVPRAWCLPSSPKHRLARACESKTLDSDGAEQKAHEAVSMVHFATLSASVLCAPNDTLMRMERDWEGISLGARYYPAFPLVEYRKRTKNTCRSDVVSYTVTGTSLCSVAQCAPTLLPSLIARN